MKKGEKQPRREVTIKGQSESVNAPIAEIYDAARTLSTSDAVGLRSTGSPADPGWHFVTGERSLDYPDLDTVLRRQTEWAGRDAKAAAKGIYALDETQIGPGYWQKNAVF